MALVPWLAVVRKAIDASDGQALRQALRLDSDALLRANQIAQSRNTSVPPSELQGKLPAVWVPAIQSYLQTLVHSARGERQTACQEFHEHGKMMLEALKEETWVAPVVVGAAVSLKTLSEAADEEQTRKGLTGSQLTACAILLQSIFREMLQARGDDAEARFKRTSSVAIANVMFKIYFKLNTITNCKNLINPLEKLKILEQAPLGSLVTFRYYTGRLAAYDELFQDADRDLTFAFQNCPPSAAANRRRVLRYLVPVRMLLGILPSDALLQQYRLTEFVEVRNALRSGSVASLTRCLEEHQAQLVQAGTYLLLEKLILATYRRLFRKCFLLHAERNPAKGFQVPISLFQQALALQGVTKDDHELQSILANLIYRKYMKGYIAYKNRVVVLSKVGPFPQLQEVTLADPFIL